MLGKRTTFIVACAAIVLALPSIGLVAFGQTRVNDKDMQALMQNLRDDAKNFQPVFNDSVNHSGVRKTSQAKDAKDLARQFVRQTDAMLDQFKKHKKADAALPAVMDSAVRIDRLITSLNMNAQTVTRWEKVRGELHRVASAYGAADPLAE